jgi:hypothetical protein
MADAASADVARLSEATSGVGASRMSLRSCGLRRVAALLLSPPEFQWMKAEEARAWLMQRVRM